MKTIAFGPEKDVPSWNWVGFDTSRELSKYFNVITFSSLEEPPVCDVIFIIKQKVSVKFIERAKRNKTKIVYCPIDFYVSMQHMRGDDKFLKQCDLVLSHCERLMPLLKKHTNQVKFVEHNNKYALEKMNPYREKGFILWVGGCQYIAYLMHWLNQHPIPHEIKILADIDNDRARFAATQHAAECGITLKFPKNATSVNGIELHNWSERTQFEMLTECKAALDIKMTRKFNQYYKPPTKAQKYIASGIPFAVNPDSYSAEYFNSRGLQICQPQNFSYWFSPEYWEATYKFGENLRKYTSIVSVGEYYKKIIEEI